MTRLLDAIQALVATVMAFQVGRAAFAALLAGLHAGTLSVVIGGSVGLLIAWLLFKWASAVVNELVHPSRMSAE